MGDGAVFLIRPLFSVLVLLVVVRPASPPARAPSLTDRTMPTTGPATTGRSPRSSTAMFASTGCQPRHGKQATVRFPQQRQASRSPPGVPQRTTRKAAADTWGISPW
jgi:hypothetical protein